MPVVKSGVIALRARPALHGLNIVPSARLRQSCHADPRSETRTAAGLRADAGLSGGCAVAFPAFIPGSVSLVLSGDSSSGRSPRGLCVVSEMTAAMTPAIRFGVDDACRDRRTAGA